MGIHKKPPFFKDRPIMMCIFKSRVATGKKNIYLLIPMLFVQLKTAIP